MKLVYRKFHIDLGGLPKELAYEEARRLLRHPRPLRSPPEGVTIREPGYISMPPVVLREGEE